MGPPLNDSKMIKAQPHGGEGAAVVAEVPIFLSRVVKYLPKVP